MPVCLAPCSQISGRTETKGKSTSCRQCVIRLLSSKKSLETAFTAKSSGMILRSSTRAITTSSKPVWKWALKLLAQRTVTTHAPTSGKTEKCISGLGGQAKPLLGKKTPMLYLRALMRSAMNSTPRTATKCGKDTRSIPAAPRLTTTTPSFGTALSELTTLLTTELRILSQTAKSAFQSLWCPKARPLFRLSLATL